MSIDLPSAAIRAAIAADDWDLANALLEHHEAELREAVEDGRLTDTSRRQSWLDLLAAQRGLIEELRTARDEAGRALDRMGRDRRGMAAYLQDRG